MPANQKKAQMAGGDNGDSKVGKCPKQTQRGRKKKTDSKGPDNVDPPKKRRGKKAGNEAARTKESPKDTSPVTKEAETVVSSSSTEPDLSIFPMSQANKFIPRFGKITKKKSTTDSTIGSAEKSPDKVKDESLTEDIEDTEGEQSNCVSGTDHGKEFDDVKVMVERLDITNDVTDMSVEIAEENESKGVKRNDNVHMNTSVVEQDSGNALPLEQEFGQGKELTKVDDITPVNSQSVANFEVTATGIQNRENEELISQLQTSTEMKADGDMATSLNDVQKMEPVEDQSDKAKNNAKKTKSDDSKDTAVSPCPAEGQDKRPVGSPVLGSCSSLGAGSAATSVETNIAVTITGDVQKMEPAEDQSDKAKNNAKKTKSDDSKDTAVSPCPAEGRDKRPVGSPVLGSCSSLGAGSAAISVETNIAVTITGEATHPAAGIEPPPVPAPRVAPSLPPTSIPAVQERGVEKISGSDTECSGLLNLETDLGQVTDSTEGKDPVAATDAHQGTGSAQGTDADDLKGSAQVAGSAKVSDTYQITDYPKSGAAQSSGVSQCSNPKTVEINKDVPSTGKSLAGGNIQGVIEEPKAGIAPRAAQGTGAAPEGGAGHSEAGQGDMVLGSGPDLDLTDSQLEDLDMDMSLDPTQPEAKTSLNTKHSFNEGNPVKLMTVVLPNLTPPKKKLPDATQKMKSLINELTALNNIVLKAKRDIEIFKRRRQQMAQAPQQQGKTYNVYGSY